MSYTSGKHVVIHPGTVIGNGSVLDDHAVVGKQPVLRKDSTASHEPLPPLKLGERCTVSTAAIVFAGSLLGDRVIVGDQACVRERCTLGDDVVVGRGSFIENDSTIGEGVKIQASAYITAYTTIEDGAFIAPCVVTTNDNYMGRTEQRHAERRGRQLHCTVCHRKGATLGCGDSGVIGCAAQTGQQAIALDATLLHKLPLRRARVGG